MEKIVYKRCRIALLAALPEEASHFKRLIRPWVTASRTPFLELSTSYGEKDLILLVTGMGMGRIQEAFAHVAKRFQPDLILSFGFAGSLSKDLVVGRVFLVQFFGLFDSSISMEEYHLEPSPELVRFCDSRKVVRSRIVTVDQPQPKQRLSESLETVYNTQYAARNAQPVTRNPKKSRQRLSESLDHLPAVVDMESHFLAQAAFTAGLPFLCFRAVSDGVDDEIDFDLRAITDESGRVRVGRVLMAALREPRLFLSFYSSWKRSREASSRLGEVLAAFLNLPVDDIHGMIAGCHLGKREGHQANGL